MTRREPAVDIAPPEHASRQPRRVATPRGGRDLLAAARRATDAARPDRALVASMRAELAAIEPARPCCRQAERAGLGGASGRAAALGRLRVRLGATEGESEGPFRWDSAADHCRMAYLRGRLLAHGSLSLAGGRMHLEVVVPEEDARELCRQAAEAGMPASVRVRRGRGVVTWKGAETIVMMLRRTGASVSAMELETRLVTRALRGQLNRALNAEGANLHRSVATASRQLAAIELLEAHGRLEGLPPFTRSLAQLRREAPDATFAELALRLGVTRSLVQRSFARIEALAATLREA